MTFIEQVWLQIDLKGKVYNREMKQFQIEQGQRRFTLTAIKIRASSTAEFTGEHGNMWPWLSLPVTL